MASTVIEANDLCKYFPVRGGLFFGRNKGWVKAVDKVSFSLFQGETLGLVGESGCGKTTTAKLILLTHRANSGRILFNGKDVYSLTAEELREYRKSVQAVFQDPYASLDPRMRIGSILAEPLHARGIRNKAQINDRVAEVLRLVGLPPESVALYPHEFSGGQRQRIAIARALAPNPRLIVLDEPVSALDVSIRAQIMNLLRNLQQELNVSYLLIAHSLATVRYMSNRVAVMYLGKVVEEAEADELANRPLHPYTKALLSAALPSHPRDRVNRSILPGEVPSPLTPPPGCSFHPRCAQMKPVCREEQPVPKSYLGHSVSCHLYS